MKFIDWFAGIGGFRRGMELAGHECVGFCEFDKYAVMSYTSMHLITDKQREYLATLNLKQRQKEILKDEYRNGEWFANDIRRVYAGDIPKADCWCFGFPCQDISVAGKRLGFTGNRSSLFFRVMYLLGQLSEEEKPTFLLIENVRNLLSVNNGWDFARLLIEMDRGGTMRHGKFLTQKISEYHRTVKDVSLLDILEDEPDKKYYLTKTTIDRLLSYKDTKSGKASSATAVPCITGRDNERLSRGTYIIDRQTDTSCQWVSQAVNISKKNGWKETKYSCTLDTKTVCSVTSFQAKTVIYEHQKNRADL